MGEFKKLAVWHAAHELALLIYRATEGLPASERFGLIVQLRRAAFSVPANLAEGCGRGTDPELRRFVRVSLGSANELEYHLILSGDLGIMAPALCEELQGASRRVQAMLAGLHRALAVDKRPRTKDQRPKTS